MKKAYLIVFAVMIAWNGFSQDVDATLPNRIGVGDHASMIKQMSSLLAVSLKSGGATDVLRHKPIIDVEYFDGSNWVDYNTTDWQNVFDGNEEGRWSIPYPEVRFVIDLMGTWVRPSAFLICQDYHGGERSYSLSVESSTALSSWNTRLSPNSVGSNTALNLFMLESQTSVDRYLRLTLTSQATSGNPLSLFKISAFTKRSSGLLDYSALPVYVNYDREVGIGTRDVDGYKLSVGGNIRAEEVKVEASPWPDYVFADGYNLMPLLDVEDFIEQNHHLPNIPSAEEVSENGLRLGEMNASLLRKVEELTLHQIALLKQLEKVKGENDEVKTRLTKLEKLIDEK